MLMQLLRRSTNASPDLLESRLYDDKTFYPAFLKDLNNCGSELIIESVHRTQTFAILTANIADTYSA
jgi:hypothetical protein